MTLSGLVGLIFVLLFGAVFGIFMVMARVRPIRRFREVPAFLRLRRAVGLAVEAGTRLHVTLGSARLAGGESASALVGLSVLDRAARATSVSDRPPVATAGSGDLAILASDTLNAAYRAIGEEQRFDSTAGRLVGLTPISYAAGTMPVMADEQVSATVLLGHVGSEAALIADAAEKRNILTVAGTDSLPGQAVLYAAAQEPLIGEEVFAGGAYLGAGPAHDASLRAEDVIRWLLIAFMIIGALFALVGLDQVVLDLLTGIFQ